MTTEAASLSKSLAQLRGEFDAIFAAPPPALKDERVSLITLRVGSQALAVRTLHTTGIARRTRILPIPTRVPGLLGILALRGALIPAYDLGALLGFPATANPGSWLLLANPEAPIALIFSEFERQLEIERSCLHESESSGSHNHLRMMARLDGTQRAVIDIPGIVEEIQRNVAVLTPAEE